MPKLSQRGAIHLLVPLLLLGGIIVGVYLVQQQTNIFPKAAPTLPAAPETSFELELEKNGETPFSDEPTPSNIPLNSKFRVDVYARSDIDEANLFTAKIKYTSDTVEFVEVNKREGQGFVKNWVETSVNNDNQSVGVISLGGGVPSPGIKTDSKTGALLMGSIIFKAKKIGTAKIGLSDGNSAIYSNANNINILTVVKGTIEVPITDIQPSPTPTPQPLSCGGITVTGATVGKVGDQTIYIVDSEGKANLQANVAPENSKVAWTGWNSINLPNGGTWNPSDSPVTVWTAPKNSVNTHEGVQVRADIANTSPVVSCKPVNMVVRPVVASSSAPTVAVVELENPINAPSIIGREVANEFYKNHEDKYDFLAISFDYNRRDYAHITVKNDVRGIGSQNWYLDGCNGTCGIPKLDPNPIFDKTAEYGSKGKLLGIGVMGPIADYIGRSDDPSWMEEVIGHQFGVYVGSPYISSDPLHINSDESMGHWNNCMYFPRADLTQKYWHGNLWKDNGDGTWTRVDQDLNDFSKPLKFDPLMLYLMGFLPADKVPNMILLEPEGGFKSGLCFPGKTIKATPREISVQDVIQRYGPRTPSFNEAQKEFSTAFILAVEKGQQPSPGAIEKLTEWAINFPEAIRKATLYSETSPLSSKGSGDGNKDGKIDLVDLSILLTDFHKETGIRAEIDMNGDGTINSFDFSLMRNLLVEKKVIH